jgi:hypothetical protein
MVPTKDKADPWELMEEKKGHPCFEQTRAEETRHYREVSATATVDWRNDRFSGGHMSANAAGALAAGHRTYTNPTNPSDRIRFDLPYGTKRE